MPSLEIFSKVCSNDFRLGFIVVVSVVVTVVVTVVVAGNQFDCCTVSAPTVSASVCLFLYSQSLYPSARLSVACSVTFGSFNLTTFCHIVCCVEGGGQEGGAPFC